VDNDGNAYVTGETSSTNFPTEDPLQTHYGGGDPKQKGQCYGGDVFVAKINAEGSSLLYSTYIGGGRDDLGRSIVVDPTGNAYITGETRSTNFPTQNPLQGALGGSSDGFVAKLNSAGSDLIYSTYFGGEADEYAGHIAIDAAGNACIVGGTRSAAFPTKKPLQAALRGESDAYLAKLNPAGSEVVYSTYLGGSGVDGAIGVAVNLIGSVYIAGSTQSTNFPTVAPFQGTNRGVHDAFIAKIVDVEFDQVLYLPQGVVGGGYATDFTFVNTGATNAAGNLIITDQSGNPFPVDLPEAGIQPESGSRNPVTASAFPGSVAAGGTLFITASASSPADSARSGWARFECTGGTLGGVGTFQLRQGGTLKTVAGVLSSQPLSSATIAVDNNGAQNRYTGFAVANFNKENINISIVTLDENGRITDTISPDELNPLGPQKQVATFLHQHLSSKLTFRGSMVLMAEGEKKFVVTALVQNQGLFTAIPVIPGKTPKINAAGGSLANFPLAPESSSTQISCLPQAVVGGGYSTTFTVVNTGSTTARGNLILTDQNGDPLTVDMAEPGIERESGYRFASQGASFPISIEPGGTLFLTANPVDSSEPAKSGWAQLECTGGIIDGVGTFQLTQGGSMQTIAGVLTSDPVESATIPVDNSDTERRYTGFAVANPNSEDINIRLVTVDESGTVMDTLSPKELNPLGPQEQVATFLHQYLSSRLKFRGSMVLIAEDGKNFAVTALIQNQGLFTAIPVISGKSSVIPE
jgi:hypothetical protein